jgi:ABC-type nitrate/sulfonate/bicarbonate transport system permease component
VRPTRRRERLATAGVAFGRLLLVALTLAVWHLLTATGRVSPLLLPPPAQVFRRLGQLLPTSELWTSITVTVLDVVAAFAISAIAGIGVGVAIGGSRYYAKVVEPLIVALYTIPIIVLYPVITLLFGIGNVSKIVFAGVYGFFPIAANTLRGMQLVNPAYLEAAHSLGASRTQLRWQVMVPAARPLITSGIRIALSLNLIAVIAGQMLAATDGIGFLIANNAQLLNAEDLYAYIVITFVLAGLINYLLTRGERADLPGGPPKRRRPAL